jgi:hypothetical protein
MLSICRLLAGVYNDTDTARANCVPNDGVFVPSHRQLAGKACSFAPAIAISLSKEHRQHRAITLLTRATPFMSKKLAPAALMVAFLLVSSNFAQSPSALSLEDEIRAGNALVASFLKLNDVGETAEQKKIEKYL